MDNISTIAGCARDGRAACHRVEPLHRRDPLPSRPARVQLGRSEGDDEHARSQARRIARLPTVRRDRRGGTVVDHGEATPAVRRRLRRHARHDTGQSTATSAVQSTGNRRSFCHLIIFVFTPRSPSSLGCVKHFDRSNGLDTELYKNIPLLYEVCDARWWRGLLRVSLKAWE